MDPMVGFEAAFVRAEHFLTLYSLLHDTRSRRIRRDWAARFKELMHWPQAEQVVRIDGQDRNSILLIREIVGINRTHFTHEYLSEFLRSAIVAVVSALDRYLHDLVVQHSWKLLGRKEEDIPSELLKIQLPLLNTKKALAKLKRDKNSRPGYLVKKAIQDHLHRQYTFQNPNNVVQACRMLGVEDFWRKVSVEMAGAQTVQEVQETLTRIVKRRNQIVHEADLQLKIKAKALTLRSLSVAETRSWVYWIRDFVEAIDIVVKQSI